MVSQASEHIATTAADDSLRAVVAANIKAAREQAGLRQRDVSAAVDVDTLAVSRWERAVVMPSPGNFALLAERLGKAPSWFYIDHGYPPHQRRPLKDAA